MNEKTIVIVGAASGAAVPLLLREYVDEKHKPALAARLPIPEGFKNWSAIVGTVGGAAALTVSAIYPAITGKTLFSRDVNTFLIAAGASALTTGIICGMFPKTAAPAAGLYTPKVTVVPAARTATSQEIRA